MIYANIDGFDPAAGVARRGRPARRADAGPAARLPAAGRAGRVGPLDPQRTEPHGGGRHRSGWTPTTTTPPARRLTEFVDALSNWYVRRSRDRFWSGERSAEKTDAYWTLYECMLTTCKLIAPFVPFLAEAMWQNLAVAAFRRPAPSGRRKRPPVRLPEPATRPRSTSTSRGWPWSGRSSRWAAAPGWRPSSRCGSRWPRSRSCWPTAARAWLEEHAALIGEELNVKQVDFIEQADQYIAYKVLPDLKRLGPRLGKRACRPCEGCWRRPPRPGWDMEQLEAQGKVELDLSDGPIVLDSERIFRSACKPSRAGATRAKNDRCVVVLSTECG